MLNRPRGFFVRSWRDDYTKKVTAISLSMEAMFFNIEGQPVASVTGPCETLADFEAQIDVLMDQLSAARKEARAAFSR